MSEPKSRRRPLIDLDQFERRMRGDEGPSVRSELCAAPAGSAGARSRVEAPVISGDFAEIEAALLRAATEAGTLAELTRFEPSEAAEAARPAVPALRASRAPEPESEIRIDPAFIASAGGDEPDDDGARLERPFSIDQDDSFLGGSALPAASDDRFVFVDDAAVSGDAGFDDEEKRSRRPLYLMAAVVIAGAAGIIASSALKRDSADAHHDMRTAAITTDAAEVAPQTTPAAPRPAPDFAQTPSPAPLADTSQHAALDPEPAAPIAAKDVAALTPESVAPAAEPAVPPAAAQSLLAPPPYGAPGVANAAASPAPVAAAEPKRVRTAAVRPDGSIAKAEAAAPAHPAAAKPVVAAKPDGAKAEVAKSDAARPDVTKEAAKPAPLKAVAAPRPVARPRDVAKPTRDVAHIDAKPAAPAPREEAQIAQEIAPEPTPAQQKPGPLAFVDTAVSSITGATTKLLDWGRQATNLTHN